jgi:hypothetical protein
MRKIQNSRRLAGKCDEALACRADRIFDGENVLADSAVIVRQGAIEAVVPAAEIPKNMTVLSPPGCTLIPGLIDAHIHFMPWEASFFCAYGVTTVRDIGNPLKWILAQRAESKRDDWPRILCVGPMIDGPAPYWSVCHGCRDLKDAVKSVRKIADAGVDGLKFYAGLPHEWVGPMADAGHCAGKYVAMHCQSVSVLQAGAAGVDQYEHLDGLLGDLWPDHPPGWLELFGHPDFARTAASQARVADRIRELGMGTTPTLMIHSTYGQMYAPGFQPTAEDRACMPELLIEFSIFPKPDPRMARLWNDSLANTQRFVALLVERGVPVLAGTDVPFGCMVPGRSLWGELALLEGAGMSPRQCLRAATAEAAHHLRAPAIGRLRPGCAADMVFVKGNPLARIPSNPKIAAVVHNGRVWDPLDLLRIGKEGIPTARPETDPWGKAFLAKIKGR